MNNDNEYNEFLENYNELHRCCPICGHDKFIATFVDYFLDLNNKENYKNLNECICLNCRDIHIFHERIKKL